MIDIRASLISILALLLIFAHEAAAQTGKEEPICLTAQVVWCDNFEDRVVGNPGFIWPATYKNPAWFLSDTSSISPQVVSSPTFQGARALRLTIPANAVSGGFMDAGAFVGGARTEIYFRWYEMLSSNFVFSPIATKGMAVRQVDPGGTVPDGFFTHLWGNPAFTNISYNAPAPSTYQEYPQNVSSVLSVVLGVWTCYELHIRRSSGGSPNGVLEGWVEGTKILNYPNVYLDSLADYGNLFVSSYWNCDAAENCGAPQYNHPEMYKYLDNMVISTQRIGCLGSSGPSPSSPSMIIVR